MIALAVYALCALTSLACTVLLLRGWRRTGARLLLWSGICFGCFFLNNVALLLDTQVFPGQDLSVLRSVPLVVGLAALLYGLIRDTA